MIPAHDDRWIRRFRPQPAARLRLICLPHAGGGASMFRNWWQPLPAEVEVLAVQLPGREDRLRQRPLRRMEPLVEVLVEVLLPWLDTPFALFGHSMGALIAFELARQLRHHNHPLPVWLAASGRRAPQLADPLPPIPNLPDAEFAAELQRRYGGVPEVVANDPEIRAVFLPTVRADLELVDTYVFRPEPPLSCPISTFGGKEDTITAEELAAWQVHTTAAFRVEMLPGGHLFINQQAPEVLQLLQEDWRHAGLL